MGNLTPRVQAQPQARIGGADLARPGFSITRSQTSMGNRILRIGTCKAGQDTGGRDLDTGSPNQQPGDRIQKVGYKPGKLVPDQTVKVSSGLVKTRQTRMGNRIGVLAPESKDWAESVVSEEGSVPLAVG